MHVLVMFCDQLRRDLLGCYGNELIRTPNIDALAADSVVFDRCYTPIAICSPARASFLTGQYPHGHHLYTNSTPPYSYCRHLRADTPMLQQWAGRTVACETAYFGKWHIGPVEDLFAAGFDRTHQPTDSELPFLGDTQWHPSTHWAPLVDRVDDNTGTMRWPLHQFPDVVAAQYTIDYLGGYARRRDAQQKQFLAYCAFPGPHGPWLLPEEFGRRYDPADIPPWPNRDDSFVGKPIYQRKLHAFEAAPGGLSPPISAAKQAERMAYNLSYIELIDGQVGRIVAELRRLGLYDDTVIVFTADHGDMAGAHGFRSKGAYMYDEIYRIPLLLRVPGVAPRRASDELVNLTDVTATVAEVLHQAPVTSFGIDPVAEPLHGQSLLDMLHAKASWDRPAHYAEYHGDWYGHYSTRMVTDGRWKLVWNLTDLCELYDLSEDPAELHNLFYCDGYQKTREQYFELLRAEARRLGDGQLELRLPELDDAVLHGLVP